MNKRFLIIITMASIFLSGCSSSILIRKSDYYSSEFSPLLSIANKDRSMEVYEHHPMFKDASLFKEGPPQYITEKNHFLFGMLPLRSEIKMSEACGKNKFRQAFIQHTWPQLLLSGITLGIYTPTTVSVWCENETI